jgi:hypothetical protein
MELIKSNKIGKRIHSPFVYRLVSNVIFAPYPFYAFSEIDKIVKDFHAIDDLKTIFRIVNEFGFQTVCNIGMNDIPVEKVCRMAKSDVNFVNCLNYETDNLIEDNHRYSNLIIWNNCHTGIIGIVPVNPEVWIIRYKKKEESYHLFSKLQLDRNAQITIELNHLGIVIFNEIFEKQNYVIKH